MKLIFLLKKIRGVFMKRLFGLFLLPFFLFSCSDSIENQLPIFNQSEKGYILKGTVKSPSESEEKSGRMAVPTLNQNIQGFSRSFGSWPLEFGTAKS